MRPIKIPYLFSFVCLGLITLMVFQLYYLKTARQLIEEQFDQKVNLAIGSALTDYNKKYQTAIDVDDLQGCGEEEDYLYLPMTESQMSYSKQRYLEESLSIYMRCYGIDDKYNVEIFSANCSPKSGTYCCSIDTNASCGKDYQLGVSFESRNDYLYDKMLPMILSSLVIFIFLSTVSFLILRALIKQKRITDNNIDFFNNTAHELKTPLTNISLAHKLLCKKHSVVKDTRYAHIIKNEVDKLTNQIDRVLFLSKMENGEHVIRKEIISLPSIIKEVIDDMQLMIEEAQGTVRLTVSNQKLEISGDKYHLSNVFRNLIENALKYCNKIPEIEIDLIEKSNQVIVKFADNGIGLCSEDKEHIFEKFQRVNTGNLHQAKGFGLGLSYVKTVIELHRGLINVESEVNKGSEFKLVLPYV